MLQIENIYVVHKEEQLEATTSQCSKRERVKASAVVVVVNVMLTRKTNLGR